MDRKTDPKAKNAERKAHKPKAAGQASSKRRATGGEKTSPSSAKE